MLVVGRLEPVKRADLAIRAMTHCASRSAPDRSPARARSARRSSAWQRSRASATRVTFAGALDGPSSRRALRGRAGVVYAPFDEDYGYVTLEAFLAEKPVITATDSGGTLEFVMTARTASSCAPDPEAIGAR